jgi:hypothetical protein
MAVTGISGGVPLMDFSEIGNLRKTYDDSRNQRMLSDLGKGLADGSLDYKRAAGLAAEAGKTEMALSLYALGQKKDQQDDFTRNFAPLILGDGQPQPSQPSRPPAASPMIVPGQRPLAMSGGGGVMPASNVDGINVPARAAVPSTNRVVGDVEAERDGLYEPRPQRTAQLGPPAMAPQAAPPAPMAPQPTARTNPIQGSKIPQLMYLMMHPGASEGQRKAAEIALTEAIKTPEGVKEYEFYAAQRRANGETPLPYPHPIELKRAGATAITNDMRGENAFEAQFGKKQADRWDDYISGGNAARKAMVDIGNMREISQRMGSQGVGANIKETVGPYAEALGVNIEGLSDIQAYSAIIQRLAPQQRAPGSGSTSDIEFKGFLRALPAASQTPQAREMMLNTMEALARHQMAEGEIASRLATKEITRGQAEVELRRLPDPMDGFRKWRNSKEGAMALSASRNSQQQNGGAKNIPDVVIQNGFTYRRQPDGSMKAD